MQLAPEGSGLRATVDGPVATVLLDRPEKRNAQSPRMWAGLRTVAEQLPQSVRVVVVRGAGAGFSAGLDRAMFSPAGVEGELSLADLVAMGPDAADAIAQFQAAFGWLARPELVSIAAVHGHAVGAGFQLALACDLRILADDTQLTMAEVPLGLVPDLGGTKRLLELVGYGRALEICVTGRRIGAVEAATMGLANRVVPVAELSATVAAVTDAILAAPHAATTEAKALLLHAADHSQDEQERAERLAQVRRLHDVLAGR